MDSVTLTQEKTHFTETLSKLADAKNMLNANLKALGQGNLERLQELRENPEKGMDFTYFMEQLQEKNESMNVADKFARLEELEYLLKQPYFARIDLADPESDSAQSFYIGKFGYTQDRPIVTDWRAKVASVYYRYRYPQKSTTYDTPEGAITKDLALKRTFEIDDGRFIRYFNNDIQLDESSVVAKKIEGRSGGVLEDIIETIQKDQMDIIEADPRQLCIVQGCVGSGKSTVAIHRLSHIFFNYPNIIHPGRSLLIAKNQILVGYLSTLFPKLGIFDINFKTIRDLLVNVIYREQLPIKYDFNEERKTQDFTLKKVHSMDSVIEEVHDETAKRLTHLFSDPEYESYSSYKYSAIQTPYENVVEIWDDIQEEITRHFELVKENPNSIRVMFYKENIKILRKIAKALEKIKSDIKNVYIKKSLRKYGISSDLTLGYTHALAYVYLYSKLVGFSKFAPYEYCVVDEGQDFSVLEYAVLGCLVMRGRFGIFGDLNQGIVSDGISSWGEIKSVIKEAAQAKTFSLTVNYRSTKQIIDFANTILSKFESNHLPKSIQRVGSEPKVVYLSTPQEMLIDLVESVKEDSHQKNKTIGVILCEGTNINETHDLLTSTLGKAKNIFILDESKKLMYKPEGIYIMRMEDCKGLEFSKVYVLNLNIESIKTPQQARKAFVAVTRAMNELVIYGIK